MKLYCLVSGANWGLRLVTWGHWPGCFNFQQSVGQQKLWWWYDMISYHVRIEFHILIHVEIQTNASDWAPPESDVSKHVGDLTLAVTDTISCKSYKEQCVTMLTGLLSLKQGTQAVIFNQWAVSFPSNQPIRVWLYMTHSQLGTLEDLSAEDDALSLSLTTWILWIHYSQPGPTLINTSSLSVINNYAVRSLITASLWKLVKTFSFPIIILTNCCCSCVGH